MVLAEVAAIFGGPAVLTGPLDAPQAGVAWIALVVGVHVVALAVVWRERLPHGLGAALPACGVVGLVLAFAGARDPAVDAVGGVLRAPPCSGKDLGQRQEARPPSTRWAGRPDRQEAPRVTDHGA